MDLGRTRQQPTGIEEGYGVLEITLRE